MQDAPKPRTCSSRTSRQIQEKGTGSNSRRRRKRQKNICQQKEIEEDGQEHTGKRDSEGRHAVCARQPSSSRCSQLVGCAEAVPVVSRLGLDAAVSDGHTDGAGEAPAGVRECTAPHDSRYRNKTRSCYGPAVCNRLQLSSRVLVAAANAHRLGSRPDALYAARAQMDAWPCPRTSFSSAALSGIADCGGECLCRTPSCPGLEPSEHLAVSRTVPRVFSA